MWGPMPEWNNCSVIPGLTEISLWFKLQRSTVSKNRLYWYLIGRYLHIIVIGRLSSSHWINWFRVSNTPLNTVWATTSKRLVQNWVNEACTELSGPTIILIIHTPWIVGNWRYCDEWSKNYLQWKYFKSIILLAGQFFTHTDLSDDRVRRINVVVVLMIIVITINLFNILNFVTVRKS